MTAGRWLVSAAVLAVLAGCNREGPLYAVGTLERDRIELAADSSEPVEAIPVTEGDRVDAGATLLRQDSARAEAKVAAATAERDQAIAALEEAVAGPRAQQIAQAQARLAAAESAVIVARQELEREKSLATRQFVSKNRLDTLQAGYDEAVARRREAGAALDELTEGTRSEVVRQARQALTAAEARLRTVGIELSRTTVTAPVDGVVEALPLELGERPQVGQTVVVLRARGPTYARIHVPEPLMGRLRIGAPADVHVDGVARTLPGRLRWIATEAAFTPYYALTQRDRSRLSYAAEVVLTGPHAGDLPVGVPVEVRFPGAGSADQDQAGSAAGTSGGTE